MIEPDVPESIEVCFDVMSQLRTHLVRDEFVERVQRQMKDGYRFVAVECDGVIVAAAGYRISENLAWGRFMYVDDLVTDEHARSCGHGQLLLDWLIARARDEGCEEFHLDSGVHRFAAHRFYLRNRMDISSHHFSRRLD